MFKKLDIVEVVSTLSFFFGERGIVTKVTSKELTVTLDNRNVVMTDGYDYFKKVLPKNVFLRKLNNNYYL